VFDVYYNPSAGKATFKDISHNLGDQPVTGSAFNGHTGDIYAATDFGVSRLAKGSHKWVDAAAGMPSVAVYGITLSPQAHKLYTATHGRGAYVLKLP